MISFVIKYSTDGSGMIDASVYTHNKGYRVKNGTLVFRKEEFLAFMDNLMESTKYSVEAIELHGKATRVVSVTTTELLEEPFDLHKEETWQ